MLPKIINRPCSNHSYSNEFQYDYKNTLAPVDESSERKALSNDDFMGGKLGLHLVRRHDPYMSIPLSNGRRRRITLDEFRRLIEIGCSANRKMAGYAATQRVCRGAELLLTQLTIEEKFKETLKELTKLTII